MMLTARWPGANAEALYQALKRAGHSLSPVQEGFYFPERWQSVPLKILRKALEPWMVREMHNYIVRTAEVFKPHLFIAFKGRFVLPETLKKLKASGVKLINWYPDVSFTVHSRYLPKTLPLYDWVFTTKTFGLHDMREKLGIDRASILLHGYDPEVHSLQGLSDDEMAYYACDVSFIGTWSPKKQHYLEYLYSQLPDLSVKIWGDQWNKAMAGPLNPAIQHHAVYGREYAKAIGASKINIAILSERRNGASSGDKITSRSFHIPASGGFMLHERTRQVQAVYEEGEDVACFASPEELVQNVETFLADESGRKRIARSGWERCVPAHSMDERARVIMDKYWELV